MFSVRPDFLNLSRLLENHPDNFETFWTVLRYSRLQRNCSDSVRTCNYHNQNLLMRKQIPGRNAYGPLLHIMSTHIFFFSELFSKVDSPVKGRLSGPLSMNFWKSSKRPLTPPPGPFLGKMLRFFATKIFGTEKTPPNWRLKC